MKKTIIIICTETETEGLASTKGFGFAETFPVAVFDCWAVKATAINGKLYGYSSYFEDVRCGNLGKSYEDAIKFLKSC